MAIPTRNKHVHDNEIFINEVRKSLINVCWYSGCEHYVNFDSAPYVNSLRALCYRVMENDSRVKRQYKEQLEQLNDIEDNK